MRGALSRAGALRRAAARRAFAVRPNAVAGPSAAVEPTAVPRAAGIADGVWRAADAALVQAALAEDARRPTLTERGLSGGGAGPPQPLALLGLPQSACVDLALADGQPAYRGRQLHAALFASGRPPPRSLDDVPCLPSAWRAALAARGVHVGRSKVQGESASPDGTVKLLLRLADGYVVEAVGIPTDDRLTVCVSSQVGCPMRCSFCATGKGGYARSLSAAEIVDQALSVQERFGRRVSHVVYMGMGEPCLNLRGVLASHRALNEDMGIAARSITISTVGVPNAIARLASAKLQSTLAVSLHAPNQALRETIVPSAKAYPLESLLADCAAYQAATGRRVSFEYALLAGVNDGQGHAAELAGLLRSRGLGGHVNLIPYNSVAGAPFERPSGGAVRRFADELAARGCGVSVRQTRGSDAGAACGQLRNEWQKKAAAAAPAA